MGTRSKTKKKKKQNKEKIRLKKKRNVISNVHHSEVLLWSKIREQVYLHVRTH